jgi:hypothetical protein
MSCGHVTLARHQLQKLLLVDPNAKDVGAGEAQDEEIAKRMQIFFNILAF